MINSFGTVNKRYSQFYGKSSEETDNQLNRIPIIHPYGKLGKLEWEVNPGELYNSYTQTLDGDIKLSDIANNLTAIYEDDAGSAMSKQISELISGAERIHFLGFGYHGMNLKILGLERFIKTVLLGTAYDMTSAGQEQAIRRFRLPEKKIELKNITCLEYIRNWDFC